jgi:flagellar biosynthetic protein FliP
MAATMTQPTREDLVDRPATTRHRRHLLRHFLEMVLAMAVGMVVLGGLVSAGISLAGLDDSRIGPELDALLMAFNMSVGMTLWMRYRGHRWPAILEMDGAMFAPFVALFPLLWVDAISEDGMYGLGHVLMLPAMLAVMLRRRPEHTHP